jgi:putative ABC transport system permease protein
MEAWDSIKNQKLKFSISGFGISWGVFITMLILGFGNAADETTKNTLDFFKNTVEWVTTGATSETYQGTPQGEKVGLKLEDIDLFKKIQGIKNISPSDGKFNDIKTFERREINAETKGVSNDYFDIMHFKIIKGRLLDPIDHKESRKVCLLSRKMSDILFNDPKANVVGKQIFLGNDIFTIVGTFNDPVVNTGDERVVFIPYETYQSMYDYSRQIRSLLIDIDPNTKIPLKEINNKIRRIISEKYQYKADDYKIVQIYDTENVKIIFDDFSVGLRGFIWAIGISTLFCGIIGIINIMFIVAKERTREIGIRKTIGASQWDIMKLFLIESFIITLASGMIGIIVSFITLDLTKKWVTSMGDQFVAPYVDWQTTLAYIFILGVSGILAGLAPAYQASKSNIINALNYE